MMIDNKGCAMLIGKALLVAFLIYALFNTIVGWLK